MRLLSYAPIAPALLCGWAVDAGLWGVAVAALASLGWCLWVLHVAGAEEAEQ